MKNKPLNFRQIEWLVISIIFFFSIVANFIQGIQLYQHNTPDNLSRFFANILVPAIMLSAFYLVHMKIIPNYQRNKKKIRAFILSLLILLVSWLICNILDFEKTHQPLPFTAQFYLSAVVLYAAYIIIVVYLNRFFFTTKNPNYLIYNTLRLLTAYILLVVLMYKSQGYYSRDYIPAFIHITVIFILPGVFAITLYNYFLVYRPREMGNRRKAKIAYWSLPVSILLVLVVIGVLDHSEEAIITGVLGAAVILLIINPVTNFLFKKYQHYIEKLDHLNIRLEETSSNLKQLTHQINPHFLFNTLNTIYGIALREKAESTAESVQKLGDMMRFMLKENTQEGIPLKHELDYLVNYIDLQKMRVEGEKKVQVSFDRKDDHCDGEIAPMLLIPFVENAFKHGISLQKKSWVKINLRCLEGSVHLDIHNSIHRKKEDDPEHDSSGIGLSNVEQRLKLLYPDHHELVIRENDLEYFVHLSIQLHKS